MQVEVSRRSLKIQLKIKIPIKMASFSATEFSDPNQNHHVVDDSWQLAPYLLSTLYSIFD